MKHEDYVFVDIWYAWRPVKTIDCGWVWLKNVNRCIDDRPEVYLGLLPITSYRLNSKFTID